MSIKPNACYKKKSIIMIVVTLLVCMFANTLLEADGRAKDHFGIYGGHPINITEVPFMAIYPNSDKFRWGCGASIVHEQFLVTAAQCTNGGLASFVYVGTDNIEEGQKYEIEKTIPHPQYAHHAPDFDIGVIKLKQKLTFSDKVKPIKMADSNLVFKDGDMFDTMGFGTTEAEHHKPSNILRKVDIPYVEKKKCLKEYKDINVTDRMICAGDVPGKDACQGDGGGALRFNGLLVGAVSLGKKCGTAAGIYSSVPAMRDFIDKTIRNNL